jgi:hypothetical protein
VHELNKALDDISSIRLQVARSTDFRGSGPATLAATGMIAMAAALSQRRWVHDPAHHLSAYLAIWVSTAAVSASLIAVEMFARTRRVHGGMADEMIRMAVEQFLPSVAAGGLMTYALAHFAPAEAWMLPGLWQVIFSLGVFSSCRFLPKPMIAAGAWYLIAGLLCISLGPARALSPWAMGVPYGVGQLMVCGVLLFRARETNEED